jgi:type I restriction enzyme S subunit
VDLDRRVAHKAKVAGSGTSTCLVTSLMTLERACTDIVDCEHKTAPVDQDGEYFAVGTPAMRGNVIAFEQARRISRATFENWTRRLRPQPGDLLFAREAPVGPIVRIPASANVAPGQRTVLLRPNREVADPDYLYYLLTSPTLQAAIAENTAGSTVPHLNVADVRALKLPPLPDLADQRRIKEVLGALDDKIAVNYEFLRTVDEYLAARFDRVVKDCDTWLSLSDIAAVNANAVKPPPAGQLRYVDIAAVGVGTYDFPALTSWVDAPGRARRALRHGDTMWSTVRPNRRSHALNLSHDPSLVASTGLAVLTPTSVGFAYLYELTRRPEFSAHLESVAEGSAYPAVRAERFGEAVVPLADADARGDFERVAAPLRELAGQRASESRALARLRDTLLPELMSGRLRVKDAERAAEEVV